MDIYRKITMVCRTCLQEVLPEHCFCFPNNDKGVEEKISEMLNTCIPEMDVYMATEPVICLKCVQALEKAHMFRTTCLKVEDEIINYLCANSKDNVDKNEPKINLRNLKRLLVVNGKFIPDPHVSGGENMKVLSQSNDAHFVGKAEYNSEPTITSDSSSCVNNVKKEPYDIVITEEGDLVDKKSDIWSNLKPPVEYSLAKNEVAIGGSYNQDCGVFSDVPESNFSSINIEHQSTHCDKSVFKDQINSRSVSKISSKKLTESPLFDSKKCKGCRFRSRNPTDHGIVTSGCFTCFICNITYTNIALIRRHIYKHALPHLCNVCGKRTRDRESLRVHLRCHTDVKQFECYVCGKCFKQKYALSQHLRVHDPSNSFKCDTCGKVFSTKYNLQIHMHSHTKRGVFICKHCNKCFNTISKMKYHQQKSCNFVDGVDFI